MRAKFVCKTVHRPKCIEGEHVSSHVCSKTNPPWLTEHVAQNQSWNYEAKKSLEKQEVPDNKNITFSMSHTLKQ
jgi:hypothetical protein